MLDEGATTDEQFDFRKWKEPPHAALANLRPDDVGALSAFTRRYGVISTHTLTGLVSTGDTGRFRDYLRQAWTGNRNALEQMLVDLNARLGVLPTGVDIIVEDLWTLTRLMFLRDWLAGRAQKCASPDCPAPYFLASRKGQKFCGQTCAVRENVRRFRERQEKQPKKSRKRRGKHAKAT